MTHPLQAIPEAFHKGRHLGITSVCSAHPVVIEAALRHAARTGKPALIEATCNQVNQDGGYTGMTPSGFRRFVEGIAADVGLPASNIILGGDHLGPNPWKHLPASEAMAKAGEMIAAYAQAGFTKLHLDTSMGCLGEPVALADEETAHRAAQLALVAERCKAGIDPVYVIGTEVPVPGGATHALDHLELTRPESVAQTWRVHRDVFRAHGLDDAFTRVIALVVQPGVEFGHTDIVHFDPGKAAALSATLQDHPGLVFEAHSTDYQTAEGLRSLVSMGFAILKVGPWLTFALREALYRLDAIADIMDSPPPSGRLMGALESEMLAAPENWKKYYSGSEHDQWILRHFSLSDRIRYYWPTQNVNKAVDELLNRLGERPIPAPVLHQYFPGNGFSDAPSVARKLLLDAVKEVLAVYESAVQ
ncbi:MAG TPA: D-tagatose-bisphosphate aldolase, class II, non-catalytic subunit [Rhizobiaceae bacterium]|nr:D-tagatose-bisphosphate aldolase, class II, non-catalytic subunit [Rhizobiaceae bacterium]